jgi:hypothetical protein
LSWQATCNSFGQEIGIFLSNCVFIIFADAEFCNEYIRPYFGQKAQKFGILNIKSRFFYKFILVIINE